MAGRGFAAAVWAGAIVGVLSPAFAQQAPPPATSCTKCHSNSEVFEEGKRITPAMLQGDVHFSVGLGCQDCHGGNPDSTLADDMDAAMNPKFAPNPFRGAPKKVDVPGFCGRCHSDLAFMRKYKPDPRIDQEEEYRGSYHGKALARGDQRVATCADCHGYHGILPVSDTRAPVYPTHVAETCAKCHADPKRMAGSFLPDGRPLPVDQYDRWRRSVHAAALLEKGDLSAPTCNDCHGNHGAAPPGVESIAFVCGQCHGREADLFRASPKHEGFTEHNEYLAESDTHQCKECHSAPDPQAKVTTVHTFTECTTCHDNHAIIRPTVAILGGLPDTPCAFCHEGPAPPAEAGNEPEKIRRHYHELRDQLLAQAKSLQLNDSERFDWLVDQALALPTHVIAAGQDSTGAQLRPEFARLFEKFRIGKTSYSYFDPAVGHEVKAEVIHCAMCHSPHPESGDPAVGFDTSHAFLEGMEQLTAYTAKAQRTLLAAQRGGVELRDGLMELDKAVDSQIQLEVLIHTFKSGPGTPFATKQAEGVTHATAALEAGRAGLKELHQRRTGLVVSLVFIALTLLGLALLIRSIPATGRDSR